MVTGSLARRYAKALMLIGTEDGSYERIGRDVRALAEAMKGSAELQTTLTNPAFPRSDREKIVQALLSRFDASPTVVNFVRLLADRERLAAVPDISRELDAMIDERSGRTVAEVASATALTPQQREALTARLEALSGRKIQLDTKEDPELLGGVIAKVGDLVYDGSLRTQLRQLRDRLVR